jgi:hypothetical protein
MANRGLNLPSTGRTAGTCLLALERQRGAPVTLHVRPHSTHPTHSSLTCQEESKFPQLWESKIPHPVHASASSVRTRPAFNFSLSRYELPRMLSVTA